VNVGEAPAHAVVQGSGARRPEELCDRTNGCAHGKHGSSFPTELTRPLAQPFALRGVRTRRNDGEIARFVVHGCRREQRSFADFETVPPQIGCEAKSRTVVYDRRFPRPRLNAGISFLGLVSVCPCHRRGSTPSHDDLGDLTTKAAPRGGL
jgi:hypothetical protein